MATYFSSLTFGFPSLDTSYVCLREEEELAAPNLPDLSGANHSTKAWRQKFKPPQCRHAEITTS